MHRFKHWPIKVKITAILVVTSWVSLLAASAAFVVGEFFDYRKERVREGSTLAQFVALGCADILNLSPNPHGETEEFLKHLGVNKEVKLACVYVDGKIIAKYPSEWASDQFPPMSNSKDAHYAKDSLAFIWRRLPLTDPTKKNPALCLSMSLDWLNSRFWKSATTSGLVMVGSSLLAILISAKLQRIISKPILDLSSDAKEVSGKMDYSIRAKKHSNDEIGLLTDSFNEMLSQIQKRDAELLEARQAAEKANRAKSTFLSVMSHEMRTPLAAIISALEPILPEVNKQGPALWSEFLSICYRQARHMLNQINDILDISRIEAGKMSVTWMDAEVKEILEGGAMGGMPIFLRTNNNRFVLECPGDLGTMRTDVDKLRRCLINLLSNAGKFTKNGTVTLSVSRWAKDGSDWLTFQVRDTGKGMTQEELGRLFVPFSQASGSIGQKFGGHGLGLAITKDLCQRLGGDIRVESEPGKGSAFIIDLPAISAEQRTELPVSPIASSASAPLNEEGCVLVIDDDPEMRRLLGQLLQREGFHVELAASGLEGLQRARELRPKVITLDVLMPDIDGWAVLSQLKSDPDLASVPVVMITVWPESERAFALGVADYLSKPVDSQRLLATLKKYQLPPPANHALVVEDDPDMRSLLRQALQAADWAATAAENGKAALEQIARSPNTPALIILDLMMPVMDGFEFIAELQKNEKWRRIPVVVVSAKDLTIEDQRRLGGQVTEILKKGSFSREELLQSVRQTVRQLLPAKAIESGRKVEIRSV
ncbi:MAG: response regulator [Verrucomicrobia bacterium]|nr:response regulator [Verrucomicrobiota bacterium]